METNIAMTDETKEQPHSNVRHIVISGGGPSVFTIFGAMKRLCEHKTVIIGNIESVYACSSGAFLGVCVCALKLGLTFSELESYIVTRCWTTLFANEVLDIRSMFSAKGLFDSTVIKKAIAPLLVTVGLSPNTTLGELYDATNIKLVMFAVDVNSKPLKKVLISHETFSGLQVHEALAMTMALPGVVTPAFVDGMCLVDGGLMANYPYNDCLEATGDDGSGVIGFKIKWDKPRVPIDSSSNIVTFLAHLMKMMAMHIDTSSRDIQDTSNTVECSAPDSGNPSSWIDLFGDSEARLSYVRSGEASADAFIEGKTLQTPPECHT